VERLRAELAALPEVEDWEAAADGLVGHGSGLCIRTPPDSDEELPSTAGRAEEEVRLEDL
jgi:hypothetical protein